MPEDMSLSTHFKKMSNVFTVNVALNETAAATFSSSVVAMNVDPLSNEIIIILACDVDIQGVDYISGGNNAINASLSTTARTTVGGLNSSNVIAVKNISTRTDAVGGVAFESQHPDGPVASQLDWIALVATDDIHLNIQGSATQATAGTMQARLWCIRGQVKDPGVYAALVQSELLG
jgi:hypothetical protein